MHGQLASFLRRNAIQAVIGIVLIIVSGTAVAFAASGAPLPFTASGAHAHTGSATHSATETDGDKSQQGVESDNQAKDDDIEGSVLSVDSAATTFMLKQEDGSTLQVSVSAQTTFEGGLHGLADLTTGLRVEVQGTQESGGGIAATKVEGKQDDANDDDDNNAQAQDVSGVIASLDSANARFTLTQQDGTAVAVLVSSQTDFSDGLHGIADLRAGMHLEVQGMRQSDGSIAATHIHAEDNGDNTGDTGGSGSNGGSGGSDGSSGSGSGHDGSGVVQTSHP